ncbi:hypothetical protein GSI_05638 [Ganoderma sinense ZZ0214-1]|uniref:DUF6534 domain-containing protein n=1 Tax=Ganoderma sinense ZZ0214-1 TaxID=1077348 RepID=A0A2G8SF53_9APHY|nr:hypothetical protein GSI_05638 [Ganoderma sinense ZZ0214-1]
MFSSPLPLVDFFPRIDNTFGAILIAMFLGIALYGLVIHQCYRYIQLYPKDSPWIKSLVLCVTTAFVGIPTKIFFALRIFRLGGHRYRVLAIMTFILFTAELGEHGFLSAGTVQAFVHKPFYEFRHYTWLVSAGAGMCLLADTFITAMLVNLLRIAFRTDRLLNTLILYTINTGLLTGTMDFLSFLFVRILRLMQPKRSSLEADFEHVRRHLKALISPNNFIYIAFGILTTKTTLPLTYGTPSTLSTVASSPSSTSFPVSDTPLVVHLADGTLHHLIPTDTLTDSSPPSPSSTPPIPIPPPHLRYRSPAPSSDSDLDSPRPASTTAVDSDSDYDSDPNNLHATGTIAVSRVINPAHVFFLQTTINTPLFCGSERTAYVARSQYPIVPGHVIFCFPAVRATTTTPAYPAYTLYGILALVEPTYFVFHVSLIPYVTNYITTLHITPSTE